MALIEEALFSRLSGFAGLQALIGNPARVYPMVFPQGSTLPAVTYQKISKDGETKYSSTTKMAHPRFQFDCWARGVDGVSQSYPSVKAIAEQVRLALSGFIGTVSGVVIDAIRPAGEHELYDPQTQIMRVSMDFQIWHQEA